VANLAGFLAGSTVNGPGSRAVIWTQGCPLRCEGCFNDRFRSFSRAQLVTVDKLYELIMTPVHPDGVTFSGGEPFAQAESLAILGERLRDEGLSIITFTGFTYGQILEKNRPSWNQLLSVTDLLIAGPYIPSMHCAAGGLIASSNQRSVYLTDRIPVQPLPRKGEENGKHIELTISPEGEILISGFPTRGFLEQIGSCKGE
jgi:anaerobic ribonucleoside-triphosphate reductase activating protein